MNEFGMLSLYIGRFIWFVVLIITSQSCSRKQEPEVVLYSDVDTTSFEKGDIVYPFSYINTKEKGWKVVIEVSGDDLKDSAIITSGRKFSSSKTQVLKLIKGWKFVYSGGDLATVTSSILVYHNGTLVDQQGIVLDKTNVGLQSIKYGWITPTNTKEIYKAISLMDEKSF